MKSFPGLLLSLSAIFCIHCTSVSAQGCVAIKNMPCTALPFFATMKPHEIAQASNPQWELSLNSRYFRSYKHFVGDVEQKQRVAQGTEVINKALSFDLSLVRNIKDKYFASLSLPIAFNNRSSLYEHYGNSTTTNPEQKRFATQSNGIGDMRIAMSSWIFSKAKSSKGNVALGLGIKLPTGNAEVLDDFHRRTASGADSIVRKAVDQSIQLGDGGFGMSIESQGYLSVGKSTYLIYSGFYLFNPRNTNNNARGGRNPIVLYNSVPDQFALRLGASQSFLPSKNLSASICGRVEGLPAHDAIGKSEGFRRPGYIISVEPGIGFKTSHINYLVNVPVAVYRNRTKSVDDLADLTGKKHGDAAFADYLLNVGMTYSFGK